MGLRMTNHDGADLLHGVKAIGEFLGMKPRRVHHLIDKEGLRVFKLGGRICAKKASLKAWIDSKDTGGDNDGQ